jgi:hypothetical protein
MSSNMSIIERLCISVVIIGIVGLVLMLPACIVVKAFGGLNIEYGEGQRTGVPFKISKKGFFWKTWEGELSLQMTTLGHEGKMVNEIFYYSTADAQIAQAIEQAAKDNALVTLKYRQYLIRGYKYGSTGYDIVAVERVPRQGPREEAQP